MSQTVYMSPISLILQQVFTNLGVMAQGAQAYVYLAGTSIPAVTYTDSTATVVNANPATLNAAGRAASASGAPVAFWALPGNVLKLVVTDAQGNQLIYLDQISGINDPGAQSTLQQLLASPASSNTAAVGPVAGADLVANSVKSYDVFADVRAANVPSLATGQTLIVISQGAITVGDQLGGLFYWNATSTATDDGISVLAPNGWTGPGRYLRIILPPYSTSTTTGSFSGTMTDGTNSVTSTFQYVIQNNIATIRNNGVATFTSAANTLTMTGLPAALFPAVQQNNPTIVEDNGVVEIAGMVAITHGGSVTFYIADTSGVSNRVQMLSTGFTTSGTKGINPYWSVTYPLF